eukprot:CAMPEP_0117427924 /NCGR_PEP_ID=MMETSP0758-20121206/7717_1 /TAXON_ID=63605 /ORGANISM="Percolomonas cosmopolitus, Strain AE-1 (ATCC 50343)" /LENGTH=242 /DNA_ID=CAMNT_0005213937 /DNA_START=133 /DNA_END=858 /DNA_ORIENTATION=-
MQNIFFEENNGSDEQVGQRNSTFLSVESLEDDQEMGQPHRKKERPHPIKTHERSMSSSSTLSDFPMSPVGSFSDMGSNGNLAASFTEEDDDSDEYYDTPLLEELGINFSQIVSKSLLVLNPLQIKRLMKAKEGGHYNDENEEKDELLNDGDLFGPLLFCLALGCVLLLKGQIHFGTIYGVGTVGTLGIYLLLNLMSENGIPLQHLFSILGYGLLPMVFLGICSVLLPVFFSSTSVFVTIISW